MYIFVIIVGLIILVGIIYLVTNFIDKDNKKEKEDFLPYKKKQFFFTNHEIKFLSEVFKYAEENNFVVFPKVRWADFIEVDLDKRDRRWISAWNKIKSKHVDFLFCDQNKYYEPVEVWEVDDSSHRLKKRVERDELQNNILGILEIKIVRK